MSADERCPRCQQPMIAEGLAVAQGVAMKLRAESNAAAIRGLVAERDALATRVKELEDRIERALGIAEDAASMGCACDGYYTCNGCERQIAERANDAAEVLRGEGDTTGGTDG